MNISDAAQQTGLPAKTLRYYEEIALLVPDRADNGYRDFSNDHIATLQFLKRARDLGFSIEECRTLLSLYSDANRTSAEVNEIARKHLDEIDEETSILKDMRETLDHFIQRCGGHHLPSSPIPLALASVSA